MDIEILVFDIDEQSFGVRSVDVIEVLRAATLSKLPQAPKAIDGVLNLRGQVVPVLDTRSALGLEQRPLQHTEHLLVVQAGEHVVALRADRARDLLRLSPDTTSEPESDRSSGELIDMVAKTSQGLVHVIDPRRLLTAGQTASLVMALAGHSATEVTA